MNHTDGREEIDLDEIHKPRLPSHEWITPANGYTSVAFGYPYRWNSDNDSSKFRVVNAHFMNRTFTGSLMQSIELHTRDYNICAQQHKLSPQQKAQFYINTFAESAHTHFFNNANADMSFEQLAVLNIEAWANDSRKLQVHQRLENLNYTMIKNKQDLGDETDVIRL